MKLLKIILFSLLSLIIVTGLTLIIATSILYARTGTIKNDIKSMYTDESYKEALIVENVPIMKQEISCGYAVIEIFAKFNGNNSITEKSLFEANKGISTSSAAGFEKEMNKLFTNYRTTTYKYLKNTELLDKVYSSLKNGIPVPFEWAAKLENTWTLHYSMIYGIDIPNDKIMVSNPYGYKEELSLKDFLNRTTFDAYENMPFYFKLAFAFGAFEKNTIFLIERI